MSQWSVRPGSKISRLPRPLQLPAVLVRAVVHFPRAIWLKLSPGDRLSNYTHRADKLATRSILGFLKDPIFRRAYARAVKAGGWDYRIPYRVHQAVWCSHLAQKVQGDYVELGTGRGFIMSAVLDAYPEWAVSDRRAFLFDTFESGWVRGGERGEPSPYYASSPDPVRANFAEWPRVNVVVGNVYDTLPAEPITAIAFLHVDLNHHEPEIWALKLLWPRLSIGGIVLLDDFANDARELQNEAMTGLARDLGVEILYTASGQGIIIK